MPSHTTPHVALHKHLQSCCSHTPQANYSPVLLVTALQLPPELPLSALATALLRLLLALCQLTTSAKHLLLLSEHLPASACFFEVLELALLMLLL
jgi:hypothetical protein